jgi:hypothetical protein
MANSKPQAWWETIRRAHLFRVLAVYFGTSFVVIQLVDIFTDQLAYPTGSSRVRQHFCSSGCGSS